MRNREGGEGTATSGRGSGRCVRGGFSSYWIFLYGSHNEVQYKYTYNYTEISPHN